MIKVYGMIILVMAMDIDGCALAKSGCRPIGLFGKKGMLCKLISLTPRCTKKCVPFRETTLMNFYPTYMRYCAGAVVSTKSCF